MCITVSLKTYIESDSSNVGNKKYRYQRLSATVTVHYKKLSCTICIRTILYIIFDKNYLEYYPLIIDSNRFRDDFRVCDLTLFMQRRILDKVKYLLGRLAEIAKDTSSKLFSQNISIIDAWLVSRCVF